MKKFRSTLAAAALFAAIAFSLVLSPAPSTARAGGRDCYSGSCMKLYLQCMSQPSDDPYRQDVCDSFYLDCVDACNAKGKKRP